MRRLLVSTLTLGLVMWQAASACGDKFLLVGRGVRFQRAYAAVHPANILIYARPTTSAKAAIRDPQFQKLLRQAGHAVSAIEDPVLLDHALRASSFDIVLVDNNAERTAIDALVASAPSQPKALWVDTQAGIAKKGQQSQIVCDLKSSARPKDYLDKIEMIMKARAPRPAGKK